MQRCDEPPSRGAAPFAWGLPGLLRSSEPAPKARSILLVWLGGGPSHLDLFDPKPRAPVEYRGPFATIATRTPGVRFTELPLSPPRVWQLIEEARARP